jgi:hypothetical protein
MRDPSPFARLAFALLDMAAMIGPLVLGHGGRLSAVVLARDGWLACRYSSRSAGLRAGAASALTANATTDAKLASALEIAEYDIPRL